MNLRQKVKQAKKELEELDKTYPGDYPYNIYLRFMEEDRLKTIINHKRKPDRYYNWSEDYEINMNKLTYIDFRADGKILCSFYHPNGKVIAKKELDKFHEKVVTKFRNHAIKISKLDANEKLKSYTTYYFSVSNDSKRPRRLHMVKSQYRQYDGDEEIHYYKD